MPKGGSGFMKAAGRAGSAISGGRAGKDWSLGHAREAVRDIQSLYGKTYRNEDITFTFNGRGGVTGTGGKNNDRFFDRAEALAKELARDVVMIDREAEREYNEMKRWAQGIRATAAERRELAQTYQRESYIRDRVGKQAGDAAEVARQMAEKGLLSHEVPAMHSNVDIMAAINDAVNTAKGRAYTGVGAYGKGAEEEYVSDIMMEIVNRYSGVAFNASKRRK